MTPEEKLASVQRQCDEMWDNGRPQDVNCPYCFRVVKVGDGPCCDLMDKAIRAIIERAAAIEVGMESYRRREFGREIMGGGYRN